MGKEAAGPRKGCPHSSDKGFVAAGRVKKAWGGGWLVAYDRTKGGPPGITKEVLPWTEDSRWIVVWKPAGRRYKAFATEAQARKVVHAASNGNDIAGFWTSPPVKIEKAPPSPPPVADCLTHTCAQTQSPPPARNLAPPPESRQVREQDVPLALRLRQLVMAKITEEAWVNKMHELMDCTKQVVQNGTLVDVPDYQTQLKAAQEYKEFVVGKSMMEQVVKEMKKLDESCLQEQVLTSAAGRMELLIMLIEAEPGLWDRYQREGKRLGV